MSRAPTWSLPVFVCPARAAPNGHKLAAKKVKQLAPLDVSGALEKTNEGRPRRGRPSLF
jgi:hypothetical protein